MLVHACRGIRVAVCRLLLLGMFTGPAAAQQPEVSLPELFGGSAVPHTIKLKELTSDWRRASIGGEMMLGMGGMMQSMMQAFGSMFGGGGSDVIYTRGTTIRLGTDQFLIGYRLPSSGIDFASLMAMGGAGGAGERPPPEPKPITPETELTLVLINMRAVASIGEIRTFSMEEAMKPARPGLLDVFDKAKEKAQVSTAESNMKQLAVAMMMYVQDYDEVLPPMQDSAKLRELLLPYVRNKDIFISPATGQPFRANPHLSKRRVASLDPTGVVTLYSSAPEPDGTRLVARLDGVVRRVGAAEWDKLSRALRLPPD
jgi:hypothetical protein